jgi:hypothetical protein
MGSTTMSTPRPWVCSHPLSQRNRLSVMSSAGLGTTLATGTATLSRSRRERRTLKTIQATRNPDVADAGPTTTAISFPGIQGGSNGEMGGRDIREQR